MENLPTEESDAAGRRMLRRIRRNSLVAYAGFAAFLLISRGLKPLVGLTCSAAVTMISFLWLEDIVGAVLQPSAQPRPWKVVVRSVARFNVLGLSLLVTIFVARFDALSVLLGFSIVVVGIIGEALYSTYKSFVN